MYFYTKQLHFLSHLPADILLFSKSGQKLGTWPKLGTLLVLLQTITCQGCYALVTNSLVDLLKYVHRFIFVGRRTTQQSAATGS